MNLKNEKVGIYLQASRVFAVSRHMTHSYMVRQTFFSRPYVLKPPTRNVYDRSRRYHNKVYCEVVN
jgi:hypothetical protein